MVVLLWVYIEISLDWMIKENVFPFISIHHSNSEWIYLLWYLCILQLCPKVWLNYVNGSIILFLHLLNYNKKCIHMRGVCIISFSSIIFGNCSLEVQIWLCVPIFIDLLPAVFCSNPPRILTPMVNMAYSLGVTYGFL